VAPEGITHFHTAPQCGSAIPQPPLKLLWCDLPTLTLRFFLSGLFTPGIKQARSNPPCPDPRKALFILPPVNFEHLIPALTFRPERNSPYILTGAALLVKDPLTVLRAGPSRNGKVSSGITS